MDDHGSCGRHGPTPQAPPALWLRTNPTCWPIGGTPGLRLPAPDEHERSGPLPVTACLCQSAARRRRPSLVSSGSNRTLHQATGWPRRLQAASCQMQLGLSQRCRELLLLPQPSRSPRRISALAPLQPHLLSFQGTHMIRIHSPDRRGGDTDACLRMRALAPAQRGDGSISHPRTRRWSLLVPE